jgi:alkanesulfonate monooxygenase SsuD/methylene tetrahydromethanopterin reductase-like flavin-dependent oxidoreductase (luciferase family)
MGSIRPASPLPGPSTRVTWIPFMGATVELASELADGIMPFLWSAERVRQSKVWIDRGGANADGRATPRERSRSDSRHGMA